MDAWPPLDDPDVLHWLALDDDAWRAALEQRVRALGQRRYDAAAFEHALRYPWERPAGSYLLDDGVVHGLSALDGKAEAVAAARRDRHPLIAFGANASPSRLDQRFAAFDDPVERRVLVVSGELHGVDVGAQASPTAFGTMPAVLFPSTGTAVDAAVLWVTPRQLAVLTRAELGYRLGRLERAHFVADEGVGVIARPWAYVSRIGALRIDRQPVALSAIRARGRTAQAMTQRELLGYVAALAFGPAARAEDLVRRCFSDMPAVTADLSPRTWPTALRLPDDHWTPFPASRPTAEPQAAASATG